MVLKQVFEITTLNPSEGKLPLELTILGTNFGTDRDVTVLLCPIIDDKHKIIDDKQPKKIGTVKPQTDNRIVVTIENNDKDLSGPYLIRVEKDGQFTANAKAIVTIKKDKKSQNTLKENILSQQ